MNAKRARRILLTLAAVVAATVVVAPPYKAIDRTAAATRHAGLGHYPRWSPPTPVEAEAAITRRVGPPESDTEPRVDVSVNWVGLVLELLGITAVTAIVLLALRRWRAGRNGDAVAPA
jgi:hypothetical protein